MTILNTNNVLNALSKFAMIMIINMININMINTNLQ